jgi:two-component system invasion response regulator UvrY
MYRILLIDDHAVLRRGTREFLQALPEVQTIGEAASAQAALTQLRQATWDLVLMDLSLPDMHGLQLFTHIREALPQQKVLVFSMYPEEQYGVRLLRNGASGYLSKESDPSELLVAVRKIMGGGRYVSPSLGELLLQTLDVVTEGLPHERLSPREFEIFLLIAQGVGLTQMATQLHLSKKTVSTHRAHVLEKMEMHHNAELMRYAFEHHLIS